MDETPLGRGLRMIADDLERTTALVRARGLDLRTYDDEVVILRAAADQLDSANIKDEPRGL